MCIWACELELPKHKKRVDKHSTSSEARVLVLRLLLLRFLPEAAEQ